MFSNPGKTYSRDEIEKFLNKSRETIDVMITRLRQKIEINPKIQNIYKLLEAQDMFLD